MPPRLLTWRFMLQAALVMGVLALFAAAATNTAANLERFNFHFDISFLTRPAGFGIIQTLIPYDEASTYARVFAVGLLNTLLAAGLGIIGASVIGLLIGVGRLSANRPIRLAAALYVGLFRNLPLLLVLFVLYFGVLRQLPGPRQSLRLGAIYLNNRGLFLPAPEWGWLAVLLLGLLVASLIAAFSGEGARRKAAMAFAAASAIGLALVLTLSPWSLPAPRGLSIAGGARLIPELIALAAGLSLYTASYIAEIVRAGIESVPCGQTEAALSLGLTRAQAFRLVVLPQALRFILPPLTNQYLNLTKNSSLAVAIGYPDLVAVFAGTALAQTGHAVEILGMTMAVYLALSLATARLLEIWNRAGWP
jgi:general L-amino acid transport system permease protein